MTMFDSRPNDNVRLVLSMIPQVRIYTASWRSGAGRSLTVFAHELPPRSARFDAEYGLCSFALTVPVFALLALLGFQFAPRIPDLKNRRLYSFAKPSAYPTLEPLIAGRINVALIRAHWPEILRVAASIRTGTVTASLIMRQLAAYPRQNGVAAVLRELGRLERTYSRSIGSRTRSCAATRGANSTKASRATAWRAPSSFIGSAKSETALMKTSSTAPPASTSSSAPSPCGTSLNRAIAAMRETEDVPDQLLAHLSPLGWEHINLTGDYVWSSAEEATENRNGFRPLRPAPDPALLAA